MYLHFAWKSTTTRFGVLINALNSARFWISLTIVTLSQLVNLMEPLWIAPVPL